jgi:hypothetical protein
MTRYNDRAGDDQQKWDKNNNNPKISIPTTVLVASI